MGSNPFCRGPKWQVSTVHLPRESGENSHISAGKRVLCVSTCSWIFVFGFVLLLPVMRFGNGRPSLPREWLALGRTPAPLEEQTEKSGKICAVNWGDGKDRAGRAGDTLGLSVSLQLNEHRANKRPSMTRGAPRHSLPCS